MHFELTNQALSTMLLDAIQFYPSYKKAKESFGILLGTEDQTIGIAEYTFPVGNVKNREVGSVTEDSEISALIKNARKIVATSTTVASYHSHPYDNVYLDWARPSNADCICVIHQDIKFELIIAITKIHGKEQSFMLEYKQEDAKEFVPTASKSNQEPLVKNMDTKVQFIYGTFGYYDFEIRAYYNTGKSIVDADLFSSEVELNKILRENDIPLERLPPEAMYSIRKIEYANRQRAARNADDKTQYHVDKIKRMELMPIESKDIRVIDNKKHRKLSEITFTDAIRWARSGQLFAYLHEDVVVLCDVKFDETASVLYLEDLEGEVGTTIDLEDYMVEAGYIEQIALCDVKRFPLEFWLHEGAL